MNDPREELLQNIDFAKMRVEYVSPIVLLCGGVVEEKQRPEDPDPPIYSVRGKIKAAFPDYELFQPEEIQHWNDDAVYKNLMDFEADLASICTVVVIILESPGSIAELGAFSQQDELSAKLIVIKSNEFNRPELANSFINLGILRYLESKNKKCVKTYPWKVTAHPTPLQISPETIQDIIKDIQSFLDDVPKEPAFKPELKSHVTVLIYELINRFIALKDNEIVEYLARFGVEVEKDKLLPILFLLEQFQIIKSQQYSDSKFYLATDQKFHKIRLTSKDDKIRELVRTKMECMDFYRNSSEHVDRHRRGAIRQAKDGGGDEQ